MEETQKVASEEKTKVVSVVVDVYSDGSRQLRVDANGNDISLLLVREWLRWGEGFVSDKIYAGMIASQLARLVDEKIIKPGFRPMRILDRLRGK
jgi:hypothetical protein